MPLSTFYDRHFWSLLMVYIMLVLLLLSPVIAAVLFGRSPSVILKRVVRVWTEPQVIQVYQAPREGLDR